MEQIKAKGSIQLVNTRSTEVVKEMVHWNGRYRHYRSPHLPGIWECRILRQNAEIIQYQLVDHAFEFTRGIRASEAPIISVAVRGNKKSTTITYRLRQRIAIIICSICLLCFEVLMLAMSLHAILNLDVAASIVMLSAFLFLGTLYSVWLIRKIKHDFLTIHVFKEIIAKNWDLLQK